MPRPERGEEDIGIEDSPNHLATTLAGHIGSGKICRSRGLILPPDASSRKLALNKLTGTINTANDSGDLETLRQIAEHPSGFMMRQGWTAIHLGDKDELEQLQKFFTSLEAEIIAIIEAPDSLKESPDYELYQITEQEPTVFERVVAQ